MRKKLLSLCLALLLLSLTSGCGGQTAETTAPADDTGGRTLCATTYPVYLFANEIAKGAENVQVVLMIDQPVSCLHDYTLSVQDMKTLEQADVVILSGAGLEDTMTDALETIPDTPKIDCSAGVELLPGEGQEPDPHIWMAPANAVLMLQNIADGLAEWDPENSALYQENAKLAAESITPVYDTLRASLTALAPREMITFHDGFSYFANAFDLMILRAIEEEAGSEASAKDVEEIITLIREHSLPAIFTEKNGATATAEMIQRECGVKLAQLDLMMSGETAEPVGEVGVDTYLSLLSENVHTILEAYA